jgi:hypothetical protein
MRRKKKEPKVQIALPPIRETWYSIGYRAGWEDAMAAVRKKVDQVLEDAPTTNRVIQLSQRTIISKRDLVARGEKSNE